MGGINFRQMIVIKTKQKTDSYYIYHNIYTIQSCIFPLIKLVPMLLLIEGKPGGGEERIGLNKKEELTTMVL